MSSLEVGWERVGGRRDDIAHTGQLVIGLPDTGNLWQPIGRMGRWLPGEGGADKRSGNPEKTGK
jgi:hypothetical protein